MKYPISGTNVKDVALILLSVGALISGFVLHKSNRTEQWISDLRSEVAAFMGFIALAHTPIQEVKDGCERNLALIYPIADKEIIETELQLKDLDSVDKKIQRCEKMANQIHCLFCFFSQNSTFHRLQQTTVEPYYS